MKAQITHNNIEYIQTEREEDPGCPALRTGVVMYDQGQRHRSGWSGFNRTTFLRDMATPVTLANSHTRDQLWRTYLM